MPTVIPRQLSDRVARALRFSAPAGSVNESVWTASRDRAADTLDPYMPSELTDAQTRDLIDVLSESAPGRSARVSPLAWADDCDALVAEVLACRLP